MFRRINFFFSLMKSLLCRQTLKVKSAIICVSQVVCLFLSRSSLRPGISRGEQFN